MSTNVLVLCTHNSARSVLAEAMLNHWACRLGRAVRAFSAGSAPSGRINPVALDTLTRAGIDTAGCRSKSWDEFTGAQAPVMRIVITVCESAASEDCPLWPGAPARVHWGYADPSSVPALQRAAAFELTRQAIGYRMLQLLALPIETMDQRTLQQALLAISKD